ncbi:PilX N-terminal domain-containing pilus assembly protein [Craterilacuibacter sp. RT1T]|uniref:pilus assembly PilX family protein n=1 Tax=Craterilacuibacter sp. RT1T TaxID=2942211 RepID=UPI0020C0F692|nr:PilX N-terminal domain-containing pilus assembly protein [Craterilacuibacter sp. RT1T]MCL6264289.1 PilX N-terminal domain-containing pilus assembly protein [Craterilacuibacter sp. RT1T]
MIQLPASSRQSGYVLIVTLILLLAVTILVLNASRSSTMGERMAGNQMDRVRAKQLAELSVRQGLQFLQANSETCLDGCRTLSGPGPWVGGALPVAADFIIANSEASAGSNNRGRYLVRQLPVAFRPADKAACMPYSVMGRGEGQDRRTVVLIQAVSFVCPA